MPVILPYMLALLIFSLVTVGLVPVGEVASIDLADPTQVTPVSAYYDLDLASERAEAESFGIYHGLAVAYATANTGVSGVIPTVSLAFPAGLNPGPWTARVDNGGTVTTYPSLAADSPHYRGSLAAVVMARFAGTNASSCGIADGTSVTMRNGTIQSLLGGLNLPTSTPVFFTKVR